MSGRYWGKRFYGLYVWGKDKEEAEKLAKKAKRAWVSVKIVPVKGGGYNLYVWGQRSKKKRR